MSSSSLGKKRPGKADKTMEYILTFIRYMKSKRYNQCNQLLYDIRTNDLREMLPDLGKDHLFYRTLLDVLKNPSLGSCYNEAMYNLAVVLGDKHNVPALIKHNVFDVILPFTESQDWQMQHRTCWCLFGIAASAPESREVCMKKGVLSLAVNLMLESEHEQVVDICGQIIYGMFHMRPVPDKEDTKPFVQHIERLLKLPETVLKYILWSLHFAATSDPSIYTNLGISSSLRPLMSTTQSTILIPMLIIMAGMFSNDNHEFDPYIKDLLGPLHHQDANVRLQACRTVADYVRDEKTVQGMLDNNIYPRMVEIAGNGDGKVKEQAVYSVLRGFGLGNKEQKRALADLGGLKVILQFTPKAIHPFNCNLLDCMNALTDEDYEFFVAKLKTIDAVPVLYELLASHDQVVNSKAANLLALIGDDYKPDVW